MKTRFSRRTKFVTPARSIALTVVIVVILVLFVLRVFFPGALIALTAPVFSAGDAIASLAHTPGENAAAVKKSETLTDENARLTAENASLKTQLADLHAAETPRGVIAGVIAGPPQSPYDSLIIGAGTKDGVYAGMRVLADGIPVGTVESASAGSARVALYSSTGIETPGWAGKGHVPVTLHGEGAGAFSADVPKDAGLVEGDFVYLPGPGAIPAGTIAKVETEAASPRATLRIRPAANPFSMTRVEIVEAPSP